jgi:DNA repair protein RadC
MWLMKSLAPHDRPREKLDRFGSSILGDNELVAVILGHGFRRETALEIANLVLGLSGGVHGRTRMTEGQLRLVAGVGPAKAAQILAAVELGRRTLARPLEERTLLGRPREVAWYLLPHHGSGPVEQFGVVMLDTKHRVIWTTVLSVGTLDASLVHPRELFRAALEDGAAAVVLFHNHPSGDPTPSADDMALTKRLVESGVLMGIEVLDHLVLADSRYYSFKEARGI